MWGISPFLLEIGEHPHEHKLRCAQYRVKFNFPADYGRPYLGNLLVPFDFPEPLSQSSCSVLVTRNNAAEEPLLLPDSLQFPQEIE